MPYTVPFNAEPSVDILSPPVVRNESNTFVCCWITSYARSLKDIPVISYNSHHVLPTMSIYIGQGGIVMIFLQLTMGIIAALFIWGFIKLTFQAMLWVIGITLVISFIIPGALLFISGLMFILIGMLATLGLLYVIGAFRS